MTTIPLISTPFRWIGFATRKYRRSMALSISLVGHARCNFLLPLVTKDPDSKTNSFQSMIQWLIGAWPLKCVKNPGPFQHVPKWLKCKLHAHTSPWTALGSYTTSISGLDDWHFTHSIHHFRIFCGSRDRRCCFFRCWRETLQMNISWTLAFCPNLLLLFGLRTLLLRWRYDSWVWVACYRQLHGKSRFQLPCIGLCKPSTDIPLPFGFVPCIFDPESFSIDSSD